MDQQKVAEFLKMLRKERGLTQQNVGEMLFVTREAVSKWERAINLPDYSTMVGLSEIYNLSINEILAGERVNESNELKINSIALKILYNERSKRRKTIIRFMILILCIFALVGLVYFIYNYNSLKVYRSSASNDDYYLSQGMIVTSKQRSFIQLGNLHNAHDNSLVSSDEIANIKFYYKDEDETKVFIEMSEINNVNLDLIEYNRFVKKKNLKKVMQNLYLDIVNTDEEVSTLHLDNNLTYSNRDIFPLLIKGEKAYEELEEKLQLPDMIQKYFKLKNGKYVYDLKVDKKTTYHCEYDEEAMIISFKDATKNIDCQYYFSTNIIVIKSEDKLFMYSYDDVDWISTEEGSEKYLKIVEVFKTQLLD